MAHRAGDEVVWLPWPILCQISVLPGVRGENQSSGDGRHRGLKYQNPVDHRYFPLRPLLGYVGTLRLRCAIWSAFNSGAHPPLTRRAMLIQLNGLELKVENHTSPALTAGAGFPWLFLVSPVPSA
jgi:hypothetical protein